MPDENLTSNIIVEAVKIVIGISIGIFSTWYFYRRANKQLILKKRMFINRLGFTGGNTNWGNIEVIYDGQPRNNINFIVVEIINDTNTDSDPIILEFSLAENCVIYKAKAQYFHDEVVKDLLQEQTSFDYFHHVRARLDAVRAMAPPYDVIPPDLQAEINLVTRNRKFVVDSLNRKSKVVIQVMGENYQHPTLELSDVTATILQKGIRVVPVIEEEAHEKSKKNAIGIISLILFLICSYPIFKYSNSIGTAVLAMIANVFVTYYLAFPIYSVIRWFKKEFF